MLSPAYNESYRLLSDIYRDLTPVYPSHHFCVLCDEVWALGKGASAAMVRERGFARVYADHVHWIRDELAKYDKRIWVAADVALEHRDILRQLKKDIVLLPWNYGPHPSFEDIILPIKEHGFDFIVTTGVSCSRKLFPDFSTTRENIRNFVRDGIRHGAMGMLNTNWDDFGSNFFSNNWYGIAYGADQGWNSENEATARFDERFAAAFYGDDSGLISQAMLTLSSLIELAPLQHLENTLFWQKLIPEYGVRSQLSMAHWQEAKERAQTAKGLLRQARVQQYAEDVEYVRYACDQVVYMADFRISLLAAAQAYRQACLSLADSAVVITCLRQAMTTIAELHDRWQQLASGYQRLWLGENRPHALAIVLDKFDRCQADLTDLVRRLQAAEGEWHRHRYLPPPLQVRLGITELTEKFFHTWLLCGSFPNSKKDTDLPSHVPGNCIGFDTDYVDEANVFPKTGDAVQRPDGSTVYWKQHTTPLGALVDLLGLFDQDTRVVAYAFCTIESPEDTRVTAALGSNDGIKVFLNGQQLFEDHRLRLVKIDEDKVELPLRQGINRLLLKIDQGRGQWGFCFRILERNFSNRDFHYRLQ